MSNDPGDSGESSSNQGRESCGQDDNETPNATTDFLADFQGLFDNFSEENAEETIRKLEKEHHRKIAQIQQDHESFLESLASMNSTLEELQKSTLEYVADAEAIVETSIFEQLTGVKNDLMTQNKKLEDLKESQEQGQFEMKAMMSQMFEQLQSMTNERKNEKVAVSEQPSIPTSSSIVQDTSSRESALFQSLPLHFSNQLPQNLHFFNQLPHQHEESFSNTDHDEMEEESPVEEQEANENVLELLVEDDEMGEQNSPAEEDPTRSMAPRSAESLADGPVPMKRKRRSGFCSEVPRKSRAVSQNGASSSNSFQGPSTSEVVNQRKTTKRKSTTSLSRNNAKKKNMVENPDEEGAAETEKEEKSAEAKQKIKEFADAQAIFYACRLISDRMDSPNTDPESMNKVKKFLAKENEKEDPKYLSRVVSSNLNKIDNGNYRLCNEYRKELTCSTSTIRPITIDKKFRGIVPVLPHCASIQPEMRGSSDDIINRAIEDARIGKVTFYNKRWHKAPVPNPELREEEQRWSREASGDADPYKLAVPIWELKKDEKVDMDDLKRFCYSNSICVIRGFSEHIELDESLYDLEKLKECYPDFVIDFLKQVPQSADFNKNEKGEDSWTCLSLPENFTTIEEHSEDIKNERKLGEELFNAVVEADGENAKKRILEIMKSHHDPFITEFGEAFYCNKFATNIDLFDRKDSQNYDVPLKFQKQVDEIIEKFPEWLKPKSKCNLLSYVSNNILGVNTAQLYNKRPCNRTAAHMENSLMASINLSLGKDSCIWFGAPYEYWGQMRDLVDKHYHKGKYFDQTYWPNENHLRKAGIPYYKFEQKAGDLVFVNTGCFHWVQSEGFCTNIAWNLGPPTATQLSTSLIAADHNAELQHRALIPIRQMILTIAERRLFQEDPEFREIVKHQLELMLYHTKLSEIKIREIIKNDPEIKYEVRKYSEVESPIRCDRCDQEAAIIVHNIQIEDESREKVLFQMCTSCKPPRTSKKNWPRIVSDVYVSYNTSEEIKEIYKNWLREDDEGPDVDRSGVDSSNADNLFHYYKDKILANEKVVGSSSSGPTSSNGQTSNGSSDVNAMDQEETAPPMNDTPASSSSMP